MALSLTRLRRTIILLSIVLASALVLAAAPAAFSAEDNDVSIEEFQPITISENTLLDLEAVAEDLDPLTMLMIFMQLEDLAEFDSNLDEDSFYDVDSLDAVNEHLGDTFVEPGYLPDGLSDGEAHFGVGDAGYATVTIDVAVARNITRLLELPVDWLPDPSEHETVTMTIDIPASGLAGWKSGLDTAMVGQMALPQKDIPESVDLDALRDAILEDPRMPDELADQLGAIDNWDETVPVPVPDGAEYEDLTINGNAGFMLTMDGEGGVIAWESNGVLHFVAGNVGADELQQIAESME